MTAVCPQLHLTVQPGIQSQAVSPGLKSGLPPLRLSPHDSRDLRSNKTCGAGILVAGFCEGSLIISRLVPCVQIEQSGKYSITHFISVRPQAKAHVASVLNASLSATKSCQHGKKALPVIVPLSSQVVLTDTSDITGCLDCI